MRVSSKNFHQQSIDAITDAQTLVSQTQLKLAIGKNFVNPSDDPVAASQILAYNQEISATEQLNNNANFAETRLQLEETTLQAVQETLFRIRDLIVQGKNTILPQSSIDAIRNEIDLRTDELVGLANTKDGSGEFIFGGYEGKTIPFTRDPVNGKLIYAGDEGQRFLKIGFNVNVAVSDSGSAIFQDIKEGNGKFVVEDRGFVDISVDPPVKSSTFSNTGTGLINPGTISNAENYIPTEYEVQFINGPDGLSFNVFSAGNIHDPIVLASGVDASDTLNPIPYVEGSSIEFNGIKTVLTGYPDPGDKFSIEPSKNKSLFSTLEEALEFLGNDDENQRTNGMNRVLTNIDQAIDNLQVIRARVGARLNSVDIEREVNNSFLIFTETALSRLQDLDFAEAASSLSRQSLALEAAQQSFVRIQGLSLFNFLR